MNASWVDLRKSAGIMKSEVAIGDSAATPLSRAARIRWNRKGAEAAVADWLMRPEATHTIEGRSDALRHLLSIHDCSTARMRCSGSGRGR